MIGAFFVAIVCALAPAQTPARDTPPAPAAATAAIAGVVVTDEARPRPLRRARVTINGPTLQMGRTAITGDDGAFAFERLPPGRYILAATKDAYVTMNYGASRTSRPGRPVTIGAGARPSVTIRLPRGAVITGVITDADGQPAQGVQVTALSRRLLGPAGDRRLVPAGQSASPTDDRGAYRIYGLPAGEYILTAQSQQRAVGLPVGGVRTMTPAGPSARGISLSPVYYPGATDAGRASPVTLAAGEERNGMDMTLQYVPLAVVTGSAPMTPGTPPPMITMARLGEAVGAEAPRLTRSEPDGRFTFTAIPPGQYMLIARSVAASPVTTNGSPLIVPAGAVQWSTAELTVGGDDVSNVALSTQPSIAIAGRLVFEGARAAPDPAGLRVPFTLAGQTIGNFKTGLPQIQLEPGGRFVVSGILPGAYRIGALQSQPVQGIRAPIGGWWLKSLVVNGRDILDAPLDIRQGTEDAIATFSDEASDLAGTVKDGEGVPAADVFVVAFSADRASWFFNSRRVAAVRVSADGRYSIRNLPPGEYRVTAGADFEPGEWFDPAVLQRLLPGAATVALSGTEKKSLDVVVPKS